MSLFALPIIGSAGLGNGLFPWARAELFARDWAVSVVAPRWTRVRIGPYLRREPEKRRYGGFFRASDHVRGVTRVAIETLARRIPEGDPPSVYAEAKRSSRPFTARFEGIGELFAPLIGEHAFIGQKLWSMTRVSLRSTAEQYRTPFVAMHVRRGDITRQGFHERELADVRQYTPESWFVAMARALQRIDEVRRLPIVVFTDGSAAELSNVLAVDGVRLHRRQLAITDLWTMSRAALLVASGYSTFGMWASYLGGMPTVYAPGKLQQRVQVGRPRAIEVEIAEEAVSPFQRFELNVNADQLIVERRQVG